MKDRGADQRSFFHVCLTRSRRRYAHNKAKTV